MTDRTYTSVWANSNRFPNKLDLCGRVADCRCQPLLDNLHLLRHSTQNSLFQSIDLVEAAEGADSAESDENSTHSLEVKGLIATEDKHESSEL